MTQTVVCQSFVVIGRNGCTRSQWQMTVQPPPARTPSLGLEGATVSGKQNSSVFQSRHTTVTGLATRARPHLTQVQW